MPDRRRSVAGPEVLAREETPFRGRGARSDGRCRVGRDSHSSEGGLGVAAWQVFDVEATLGTRCGAARAYW